jgi:hypothetical protein
MQIFIYLVRKERLKILCVEIRVVAAKLKSCKHILWILTIEIHELSFCLVFIIIGPCKNNHYNDL